MTTLSATMKTKSHRDCFLHIPPGQKWRKLQSNATSSNNGVMVLEMTWSTSQFSRKVTLSGSPMLLMNAWNMDEVQLDPIFAAAIGIPDNQPVCVQAVSQSVVHCKTVRLAPFSPDDYRVCDKDREFIMDHMQDQIRVMHCNLCFALFKGSTVLCPKLKVVAVEPSSAVCALLVKDTIVEIVESVPPVYNRSITVPATDHNSSSTVSNLWNFFSKVITQDMLNSNSTDKATCDSGYSSGDINSGPDSANDSEVTTPISATSTPSVSPINWDFGAVKNWFMPQSKGCIEVKESTVDPVLTEAPSAMVRGKHKKQVSWPIVNIRPQPANIDTPPMNVIMRVQPYSSTLVSFQNDAEQLDVFVHPQSFPTLYMRRYNGQESSSVGYLVKLQPVTMPDKSIRKLPTKAEQEEENLLVTQHVSTDHKGVLKGLVVRLCFAASHHFSSSDSEKGSSTDLLFVKPGHVVISDIVRRQLGVRDFSRVRLTDVTEDGRVSCNDHTIKLTPLSNQDKITKTDLCSSFLSWVHRVGLISPFGVPLVYHMILSYRTKSEKLCTVEVKLSHPSSRRKSESLDDGINKAVDFVLLEERDFTSNRVSLTVEMNPVENGAISSSTLSPKKSSSNSNDDKKLPQLPEIVQLREPLLLETQSCLGGVDDYIKDGFEWVTIALEKQLSMSGMSHGLGGGALLICGKSSGGSVGCGITSIAKEICRKAMGYPLLAHVIVVECASYRGKPTRFKDVLREKMVEACWLQPSVLLLDDLDCVASSLENGRHDHSTETLNAERASEIIQDMLVEEMSRGGSVVVIATAQTVTSIHPKLLPSRGNHLFRKTIEVSTPNMVVRQEILKVILKNQEVKGHLTESEWKRVSIAMEGFVLKDLMNIVERAIHNLEERTCRVSTLKPTQGRERSPSTDTLTPKQIKELCYDDFAVALNGYKPVALRSVSLHKHDDVGFDSVGGLENIKTTLIETIQWPAKFPKVYSSFKLKRTSGVLLFGAPGTGKTMLARALGREFGLNFIGVKGPELLSKYIGASEQAVRDIFVRAHSARPCILFFDEFDALAPQRGHDNTGVTDRVVNQLLTQLDGIESLEGVYILAASSRPDLIDPALLRPGRIDKYLHCELPNKDERVEILKVLSISLTLSSDIDFHVIATACEHFTGADLKALLYNAQLSVAHELLNKGSSTENTSKGGPLNGTSFNKIWCSPNMGIAAQNEEMVQKVKIIQRNVSRKHTTKKKQITVHENLVITQSTLLTAVDSLQPSLSQKDRLHYSKLYHNFINKASTTEYMEKQKATLA